MPEHAAGRAASGATDRELVKWQEQVADPEVEWGRQPLAGVVAD